MHSADITAALKRAGYGQAELGRSLGVGKATVSAVINGKGRSARVEERISEITGLRLKDLWPQHYGGSPAEPGFDATKLVDPQRLAWICHAIERSVADLLGVHAAASPRVLANIYNKVISRGRGSDDDIELAKAEVAAYLETLRDADIPEKDLASRIVRTAFPALPDRKPEDNSRISVTVNDQGRGAGNIYIENVSPSTARGTPKRPRK